MSVAVLMATVDERFWAKVRVRGPSECWEWIASLGGKGYGQFYPPGGKGWRAHRWAYASIYGPIPAGRCVLHRCDNPLCVNPAHLALGSQAENMADMARKGRWLGSRIPLAGERHPNAKLTTADVENIRASYQSHVSSERVRALAAQYGVCRTHIYKIVGRSSWRHLA